MLYCLQTFWGCTFLSHWGHSWSLELHPLIWSQYWPLGYAAGDWPPAELHDAPYNSCKSGISTSFKSTLLTTYLAHTSPSMVDPLLCWCHIHTFFLFFFSRIVIEKQQNWNRETVQSWLTQKALKFIGLNKSMCIFHKQENMLSPLFFLCSTAQNFVFKLC